MLHPPFLFFSANVIKRIDTARIATHNDIQDHGKQNGRHQSKYHARDHIFREKILRASHALGDHIMLRIFKEIKISVFPSELRGNFRGIQIIQQWLCIRQNHDRKQSGRAHQRKEDQNEDLKEERSRNRCAFFAECDQDRKLTVTRFHIEINGKHENDKSNGDDTHQHVRNDA